MSRRVPIVLLGAFCTATTAAFAVGEPLVLVEEQRDLPLVSVEAVLRTGSTADPRGKEGLMELTARLLRRGAGRLGARQIDETIDGLGATLSVEVETSSTHLRGQVLARNLESFLELLGDVVARPTFPTRELDRLRREMQSEVRSIFDDDETLAFRHFRKALFGRHRYGRPPGGTVQSLADIGLEDVRAHYRRHFVASNLILGAAGDVDRSTFEDLVADSFARVRRGRRPRVPLRVPTMPPGRRLVLVDKPDRTQAQVYLGHVGLRPSDEDYFPLMVANTAFGGTFTARLTKEIRSERGLSYGAYSMIGRARQPHGFWLWTFPSSADVGRCAALEVELLERFAADGITEAEIEFAKSYLVKSRAFQLDTAAKRLGLRIDEEVLGLGRGYHADWIDRVREVTLATANEAVRRRVQARDLVLVVVATAADVRAGLEEAMGDPASVEVVPYDSF